MGYEKRDAQLLLRLSETERRAVTDHAEREGITPQMWIRFLIRATVGLPSPGKPA